MAKVGVIMLDNSIIVGDIEIDDSEGAGSTGAMWSGPMSDLPGWLGGGSPNSGRSGGRRDGSGRGRGSSSGRHSDPDKRRDQVADPDRHAAQDEPKKRHGRIAEPSKPSGRSRWHKRVTDPSRPGVGDDPPKPHGVEDPDKHAAQDDPEKARDIEDPNKQQVDALEPTKPAGGGRRDRGEDGLEAPSGTSTEGGQASRGSWYSQFKGRHEWVDTGDRPGSAALGVPDDQQGIALPDSSTLGQWFHVTAPNGKTYLLQQTDVGPSNWTGRGIDISSRAADMMGYSPRDFPTNGRFTFTHAGPPAGVDPKLSPQQQAAAAARRGASGAGADAVGGGYQQGIEPRYTGGMHGGLTPEQVYGGLKPEMRARLQAMYRDMPPDLREGFEINEAFRTREYQQELYDRLHGRAAVAPPGHSRHEVGEAVDISDRDRLGSRRLDWIHANVDKYGLEGILGGRHGSDTGHIQFRRDDERTFGPPGRGSQPAQRVTEDLHSIAGIRERVYGGAPAAPAAATPSTSATSAPGRHWDPKTETYSTPPGYRPGWGPEDATPHPAYPKPPGEK